MTATQQKLSIRPLADRVVLELVEDNEYTAGGIIIPDSAREKPQQARVVAVGPGAVNPNSGQIIPMSVTVGQVVLMEKYGTQTVKIGGEEYIIAKESAIIGVVEG